MYGAQTVSKIGYPGNSGACCTASLITNNSSQQRSDSWYLNGPSECEIISESSRSSLLPFASSDDDRFRLWIYHQYMRRNRRAPADAQQQETTQQSEDFGLISSYFRCADLQAHGVVTMVRLKLYILNRHSLPQIVDLTCPASRKSMQETFR